MAATYSNGVGQLLSMGAATTRGIVGSAQSVLTGTSGNDALRSGGANTMIGGKGDDTYYVYTQKDIVVENEDEGTDSINSYANYYVLPKNVENLILSGNNSSGMGNAQDNIIISAGAGKQTLNGGAGNDVLIGGASQDTFIVARGEGSDVVVNFDTAKDIIQLNSYGDLNSFAKVKAAMTQAGADTVIKLGGGETLTIRDHKISDFSDGNFRLPIDLSNYKMTFSDNFDSFSGSATGQATTWMTKFPYSGSAARTLSSNHEDEYYSDSSVGVNPFSIKNGVLDITAARATPGVETPAGSDLSWTSGIITTYKSFAQQYGYFEVNAQLPAGQGFWPAFWLLPADNTWPPELDIFEVLGNDPSTVYASTHSKVGGPNSTNTQAISGIDTSKGFHTYGVDWEADNITWYIDGNAVASAKTPDDMKKPMYMLLNLAVGDKGSWPGATDATTPNEGHMLIDYVHVYASKPTGTVPSTSPAAGTAAPAPVASTTPAVAPTLALATASKGATLGANAALTGKAAAGATVTIYDGTTKVATVQSDAQTGAFSVSVQNLGSGKHTLTAKAGDAAVSSNVVVVVGTAADIGAQLSSLQASGKVAAIVLTDSQVIPVASVAAMTGLISGAKDALAAIQGPYSFVVTTASGTGTTVASYDAAGRMTATVTTTLSNGQVTRSTESNADGSSKTVLYTNGLAVSQTVVNVDKTKNVLLSNITGKTYVTEQNSYDAAGTLTSTIRSHSDGTNDWTFTFDKQTGVKTTTAFDAAGTMTAQTTATSAATVEKKYVGSLQTSEYTYYAPGSQDVAKLKLFTDGVLTRETVKHSNQTSDTFNYALNDPKYTVKHDTIDAAGKTIVTDLTAKDGSHLVTGFKAGLTMTGTEKAADTFKGLGGDTFVFQKNSGADSIVGFHAGSGSGHDVISIDHSVAVDMNHLSFSMVGRDTVIHLTATDSITLQNVDQKILTHDNFWFY